MYFSNAIRSQIKEENPEMSFGDIGKEVGKRYKALSEEERKKWDDEAAKDKVRYQEEMEDYSGPEDNGGGGGASGSLKKKPSKDPNAPKKASSAYMQFSIANRARIKEENPDASFGDIVSCVSLHSCFGDVCLFPRLFCWHLA